MLQLGASGVACCWELEHVPSATTGALLQETACEPREDAGTGMTKHIGFCPIRNNGFQNGTGMPTLGVQGAMGPVEGAVALCCAFMEPAAKQVAKPVVSVAGLRFVMGSGSPAIFRACGFTHWPGEDVDDSGEGGDIVIDIS